MRRALHSRSLVIVCLVALGFTFAAHGAVVSTTSYITSNFNDGTTDGWTVPVVLDTKGHNTNSANLSFSNVAPLDPFPSFQAAVNPGYMNVQDTQNNTMILQAPTEFSGNLSQWFNGQIFFDAAIKQISGGPGTVPFSNFGVITINTSGGSIYYDVGTLPVDGSWGRLYAPMTNGVWRFVTTDAVVTNLNTLLQSVNNITIDTSLRQSSSDNVAIDEFTIGMPEPGTYLLFGTGIAGLFAARKRLRRK
jgi:hypothetical protein